MKQSRRGRRLRHKRHKRRAQLMRFLERFARVSMAVSKMPSRPWFTLKGGS